MSTLYHYTNAAGLLGIMSNLELWASEYRFLNDVRELKHGLEVFKRACLRFKLECGNGISEELWYVIDQRVSFFLEPRDPRQSLKLFVVSLTSESDLLSQWRGYNGGAGFCIGMEESWLRALADKQGFTLARVIYDEESQETAILHLLLYLLDEVSSWPADGESQRLMLNRWWVRVIDTIVALKDPSFREECESRLFLSTSSSRAGIKFRTYAGGLIPYVSFSLDHTDGLGPINDPRNLGFSEIVIGPALREQQVIAVDALQSFKRMRFQIRKSSIPYVPV